MPRMIFVRAVLIASILASVAIATPRAQNGPLFLSGPDMPADYAYLSLIAPRSAGERILYGLHYNLCNLRKGNLSFAWFARGFGFRLSPNHPLQTGLCATYELSGSGYVLAPSTTLRFSTGGDVHPGAYLPCTSLNEPCLAGTPSSMPWTAVLTAVVADITGALPNGRPGIALPLRIAVRTSRTANGAAVVQIDWAGKGLRFLASFPDDKIGINELKQMITTTANGNYDFMTFPALANSGLLIDSAAPSVALRIDPGSTKEFGTSTFGLSEKSPLPLWLMLLVLDGQNGTIARMDVPLPVAGQR
jgi:hypothetical protein